MPLCVFYSVKCFFSILVQLEIPVESDQSFSEQGSPGNTSHTTAPSTDASLQEEKVEDAESSSVTVTQEPSAAPGSNFDFILNIDAFLKAAAARCFVLVQVSLTKMCVTAMVTMGENAYFSSLWSQFWSYALQFDSDLPKSRNRNF